MKTQVIHQSLVQGVLAGSLTMLRRPLDLPEYLVIALNEGATSHEDVIMNYSDNKIGDIVCGLEEWRPLLKNGVFGICFKDATFIVIGIYAYHALCQTLQPISNNPWQPASTMPEEFSRIKLKVTDLGVQRLGDLTAEGMINEMGKLYDPHDGVRPSFIFHWNLLHPDHTYRADQWSLWQKIERIKDEL